MNKLVSIVMPTLNGATSGYIRESIESVLKQTYENFEFIIVNDCSTDYTLDILNEYANKDSRVKIINNSTNQKLPQSLNIGFELAKGEYFTWTSDDNYFHINALEEMVKYLDGNQDKILVCCDYEIKNNDVFQSVIKVNPNKEELITYNSIGACFMYRSSVSKKIGGYNKDEFKIEDYEYWLRLGLVGDFGSINKILYTYRYQPNSLTMTAKLGEIDNKVNYLLCKFTPLYLDKYPNLKINITTKLRLAIINNLNFENEVKKLFNSSNNKDKRAIYVFLKDRFKNTRDNIYKRCILQLGIKYILKFYIFCKKYKLD